MLSTLKNLMFGTPLYYRLREYRTVLTAGARLRQWEALGRPDPPPHEVKEAAIIRYAEQYGVRTMVETGTYLGDMVQAMKRRFDKVFTIELSPDYAARARRRFASSPNVTVLEGSSDSVLESLVTKLHQPVLFWLDAHYSGGATARGIQDTPIVQELELIFKPGSPKHVILIDDARLFGTDADYPTVEALTEFVRARAPGYSVSIADDAIRILPNLAA
jgi:hypothetical protein